MINSIAILIMTATLTIMTMVITMVTMTKQVTFLTIFFSFIVIYTPIMTDDTVEGALYQDIITIEPTVIIE